VGAHSRASSGQLRKYVAAEQPDMVEIGHVVKVEVDGVRAGRRQLGHPPGHLARPAGDALRSIRSPGSPSAAARWPASRRVGPQHTGSVVDSRTAAGSRPDCSQMRRKLANRSASPSDMPLLNSSANRAASAGGAPRPGAPDDDGN
jgi:hypothetical protein